MSDIIYPEYAKDETEAKRRAKEWKDRDPFKRIKPSLLSAEHIRAYVRQTAMLFPFEPKEPDELKGASYELKPGRQFIRWDDGKKIITEIAKNTEIVLPPNSITFTQIEARIRLPNYIAIRFNLRIKHVHRGLLLGTGPLVDPGFEGDLLIPLHNLTASEYRISASEGLIWVEFTKTSRAMPGDVDLGQLSPPGEIFEPSDRRMAAVEFYFEKANQNRPIESSIPGEIKAAKEMAATALSTAKTAKTTNQVFAGIGFLAVLTALVGLANFLQTANGRIDTVVRAGVEADEKVVSLRADLDRAIAELRSERDAIRGNDATALAALQDRLNTLEARLRALENARRGRR